MQDTQTGGNGHVDWTVLNILLMVWLGVGELCC